MTTPAPRRHLAFLAPMPSELRPLLRMAALRHVGHDDPPVYRGHVGEAEIVATTTGIGTTRAAHAAERVLGTSQVDHLVVIGVAGAIDRHLRVGKVVVPEVVIDAATQAEYRPSRLDGTTLEGKLLTTDDFVTDADALSELADRGITAIDMETAAIARVCEERGCPWSVFRGISDDAFDPAVDEAVLGLTRPDGSANLPAVARFVLARPSRIRLLSRLARDLKTATNGAAGEALRACTR